MFFTGQYAACASGVLLLCFVVCAPSLFPAQSSLDGVLCGCSPWTLGKRQETNVLRLLSLY